MVMNSVTKKSCRDLSKSVEAVFYDAQYTKKHDHLIKNLRITYEQSVLEEFLKDYIKCLKICFLNPEKSSNVEHALDFAAKFSVSLSKNLDEDETCPFLSAVFEFLFENHECDDLLVRFRVCHFINRLLDSMPHDASLDNEVFNKIAKCMMERLQDRMASVRAEAVYALHRLQTPGDPNCNITSVFMYHLTCDPSYDVRSAIVQKIAINKKSLPVVLRRIHDTKDVVRKEAYKQLYNLSVQRFTIRQRQTILERGLNDKFEMVRLFVTNNLIPSWLKAFDNNYMDFVQAINVESLPDVTISVLQAMFKQQHVVNLPSLMREMHIVDKLVPLSKLSSESVVFWRAMAEYLKPKDEKEEEKDKYFENVLPDLTPFTQYIRQYFFSGRTLEDEKPNDFVLTQLLQMAKIYDFSDEMGRGRLKQLCIDLLQTSHISLETTAIAAEIFNSVIPEPNIRLSVMAEIISELREPLSNQNVTVVECDIFQAGIQTLEFELSQLKNKEKEASQADDQISAIECSKKIIHVQEELAKLETERTKIANEEDGRSTKNDPATLMKCLTIVISILQAKDIVELNPTLHSLVQNVILSTLELPIKDSGKVHSLCLQALGMVCILDVQLAKEQLLMFCFKMANTDLCLTALKVVFDLLLHHGLEAFSIEEPEGDFKANTNVETPEKRPNLIFLLVSLLDSQSAEMRNITMQGLCKLIYSKRLCNPYLITHLILLWFNPELENDAQLRQPLAIFFNMFASNCPHAPGMLLESFLPTLKIFSSNYAETINDFNIDHVAALLINLTRQNVNRYNKKGNIHNILAMKICVEIIESSDLDVGVLMKALQQLELNFSFSEDIDIIYYNTNKINKLFEVTEDKASQRAIAKFKIMLEAGKREGDNTMSTVQNTLPEDNSMLSTKSSLQTTKDVKEEPHKTFLLLATNNNDTESEDDEDDELDNELLQAFQRNIPETLRPTTSRRGKDARLSGVSSLPSVESPLSDASTSSTKVNKIESTSSSEDTEQMSDVSDQNKTKNTRKKNTTGNNATTLSSKRNVEQKTSHKKTAEKELQDKVSNDESNLFKTPGPSKITRRKVVKESKSIVDESKTPVKLKRGLKRNKDVDSSSVSSSERTTRSTRGRNRSPKKRQS